MQRVKYALIGFGGIAENRIAKEGFACDRTRFSPSDEVDLVGATDINPARKETVESLGLTWYNSSEAILSAPHIDAVFITTNNITHAQLCKEALNAGKHVIVEKPMATNSADAIEIQQLAQDKKLSLAVDHMMTENAYNIKAKDIVHSDILGTINDACFHMEFSYGSTPEEAKTWRCSSRSEMGGPIGDVASHCFYVAEFIFNSKITQLACVYYPKLMNTKVEDGAYIKFEMENGITASARVAFNEPRGGLEGTLSNLGYEIYGDKGVLRSYGTMFQLSGYPDEPIKIKLELDRFTETKQLTIDEPINIYQSVIRKHAQSILSSKPQSGANAIHNLKLIEAAHQSAQENGNLKTV